MMSIEHTHIHRCQCNHNCHRKTYDNQPTSYNLHSHLHHSKLSQMGKGQFQNDEEYLSR